MRKMFVLHRVNKADYRTKKNYSLISSLRRKEKSKKNICPHVNSGLMRFQVT